MKFTLSVLLLLLCTTAFYSQQKYFIYFKDKGISPNQTLNKSSALFQEAEKQLTERAIERRKSVMGNENYITVEDLPVKSEYLETLKSNGIKIHHVLKWFNAASAYLSNEEIKKITNYEFVDRIEPVRGFTSAKPIDESKSIELPGNLNKTTGLDYGFALTQNSLSEIPAVHDLGVDGKGVIIGILDTGFRWKTVPSLQTKNVIAEYDFIFKDENTANEAADNSTQDRHGTRVFSIMAGYDPGKLIGPAYASSFLLAKTEDIRVEVNSEEDNYAAALEWMESKGVDITSSSLGYRVFDKEQTSYTYQEMNGITTIVAKAANLAFDRGVSTFTAAGNEGMTLISSPGDAFNIITVGAVSSTNSVASFSSRGPASDGRIKPEIVAQGVSVYHAIEGTINYGSGNGTSYATPIAAGVAGLLKSAFPHLNNRQIRNIFLESGDNKTVPNNERGWGLISAKRAINYPNLKLNNNTFILNKAFLYDSGVKSNSVSLNYASNSGSFTTLPMIFDGKFIFSCNLPNLNSGLHVEFYFTYESSTGEIKRDPFLENYKLNFGDVIITLSDINEISEIPLDFHLYQNYPNPFNPETTISYAIPSGLKNQNDFSPNLSSRNDNVHVTLKVYDVLGKEVATLVDEKKQPGMYNSQFSILNPQLSTGVYFYRLTAGSFSQTKKMVLVK
jgi:subtilisin family serine protease